MVKSTSALKLDHVSKAYGRSRGIKDVSLEVKAGEIFGFLGPNGAGKSTTINTVLDLLKPDTGTIQLFGLDHHKDLKQVHQNIGYLSGDMETDPTLTGRQYLNFAANLRGGVDKSRIDELAKRLKCDLNRKIKHLSRGNRQKIGLVAALMHDPDLLILDEPTSGLDPLIQNEFNQIIKEHQAEGKTTFMSSHVLSEVQETCDRVGFIKDGVLIKVEQMDKLMAQAARKVSVVFESSAPDSRLKTLPGVSNYRANGQRRNFDFSGDYNLLLRVLSYKSMTDVEIAAPDLEELFMSYYQGDKHV
ncbi:MAG TPA: ABC transporter ATP-binding protein [Candidatus Saccharimonadales bacterium]|nr:ABC transporter ATP-binding protein [Candidatus Saccharimonadales bacterium]